LRPLFLAIMTQVTIVGCGIIGATVAYELSQVEGLAVRVLDRHPTPVQPDLTVCPTSTGAALGVLMGAISKKQRGHNLRMRLSSLQYYETLIPKLVAQTGRAIPWNQQGLLLLQFEEDLASWEKLIPMRQAQGWELNLWAIDRLKIEFPQINLDRVTAGIYSPQDRQVNPVLLTQALILAAQQNGAAVQFDTEVVGFTSTSGSDDSQQCRTLETTQGPIATDWLIIAAGLGSTPLTQHLGQPLLLDPILGQAIQFKLDHPLGTPDRQPVITGNDVHLVPLGNNEYWVGATVEFPIGMGAPTPAPESFANLRQQAIALFPALSTATTVRTWHGLRPRPQGRPAPIVEPLTGYRNVLLATGHYRNGVLLAPATAMAVRRAIEGER
jgi:glycine oxidase